MKLNEKQLTLIFCIIFALLIGVYVCVQFPQGTQVVLPPEIKHAAQPLPPFSEEEQAIIEKMRSEKLAPISKEDQAIIDQMRKTPLPPLSAEEEAYIKRMRGI